MRAKTPPFRPFETLEEREARLKAFIQQAIGACPTARDDAILLVARSPESAIVRAILDLSSDLAACGKGARIVLAGGAVAREDETWSLSFSGNFVHEIRLTSSPRILDGHEQIIVGDHAVWFGDCMRRDPSKRDAYSSFAADAPDLARQGRFAFGHLWQRASSIYRNAGVSAVVVTASSASSGSFSGVAHPDPDDVGAVDCTTSPIGPMTAETLAAWEPSTRH